MQHSPTDPIAPPPSDDAPVSLPCVMTFNTNDPSGAGGLAADLVAMASASAHVLSVVTGTWVRDTSGIRDHFALDEETVDEQARCALEDITVSAFKAGFLGSPDNVDTVADIASDYPEVPLITYVGDLSWWNELSIDTYLEAVAELLLPQTTVLVGNHSSLCRWLLPDWEAERPPGPRDVARAAAEHGVPYTLVTGFNAPDQYLESHLASPETVLATARYERFEATFTGAGDTLSAALAALLAAGEDLQSAVGESMTYLDQCLDAGFQPGMGHAVPDRMFWAHEDPDEEDPTAPEAPAILDFPLDNTQH
ncbi:MAG: bifunctional hydroxymethylpyrimidine kinase/phosphomethylpyrimidine kinase [Burkholderiaceae bacterium]|nr:bifunctional hydroxymethylpyrimidine kinase/phosphomethylpyrimidine kinase [Burkholderiaceae bacterium]